MDIIRYIHIHILREPTDHPPTCPAASHAGANYNHIYIYIYRERESIYIYIYIERERERCMHSTYIYINTYGFIIYLYIYIMERAPHRMQVVVRPGLQSQSRKVGPAPGRFELPTGILE